MSSFDTLALAAVALASMVLTGASGALLVGWLRPTREASRLTAAHRPGSVGQVGLAIPRGGMGTVVLTAGGRTTVLPAVDVDAEALEAGTRVVVVELTRKVAHVRALPPELEEVFS